MKRRAKANTKQFSLRIDEQLLRKFEYIADSQDRSINWMLINLITKSVRSFEEKHGEINLSESETLGEPSDF